MNPKGSAWLEKWPLSGRRVVVTRNRDQGSELSKKLAQVDAEVLELPLVQTKIEVDPQTAEDVFAEIGHYDWLVFTSAIGVKYFFDLFFNEFEDIRALGLLRIAAAGEDTAQAIKSKYLKVDLIPDHAMDEALADALIAYQTLDNVKILVVTGNRNVVVKKLVETRAIVDAFSVYRTEKTDLSKHAGAESFRKKGADAITFTNSATVQSFIDQAASLQLAAGARRPVTCSIGTLTSQTMRKAGIPVDIEAAEQSLDGVIQALIKNFERTGDT